MRTKNKGRAGSDSVGLALLGAAAVLLGFLPFFAHADFVPISNPRVKECVSQLLREQPPPQKHTSAEDDVTAASEDRCTSDVIRMDSKGDVTITQTGRMYDLADLKSNPITNAASICVRDTYGGSGTKCDSKDRCGTVTYYMPDGKTKTFSKCDPAYKAMSSRVLRRAAPLSETAKNADVPQQTDGRTMQYGAQGQLLQTLQDRSGGNAGSAQMTASKLNTMSGLAFDIDDGRAGEAVVSKTSVISLTANVRDDIGSLPQPSAPGFEVRLAAYTPQDTTFSPSQNTFAPADYLPSSGWTVPTESPPPPPASSGWQIPGSGWIVPTPSSGWEIPQPGPSFPGPGWEAPILRSPKK